MRKWRKGVVLDVVSKQAYPNKAIFHPVNHLIHGVGYIDQLPLIILRFVGRQSSRIGKDIKGVTHSQNTERIGRVKSHYNLVLGVQGWQESGRQFDNCFHRSIMGVSVYRTCWLGKFDSVMGKQSYPRIESRSHIVVRAHVVGNFDQLSFVVRGFVSDQRGDCWLDGQLSSPWRYSGINI